MVFCESPNDAIDTASPEFLHAGFPVDFTPRAQAALGLARKEADRLNHNFVGTEHLLLGLVKLGQGAAITVLQRMGLRLDAVRAEVENIVGAGPEQKLVGAIPYTPRVKKAFSLASKEAKALRHTYVGTEHILLGLLREGHGIASHVVTEMGINADRTRKEVLKELDPNFAEMGRDFNGDSQRVLASAHAAAQRIKHPFVDPEHVLLGVLSLQAGFGTKVLQRAGLDFETVRRQIENLVGLGRDSQDRTDPCYTVLVDRVLSSAGLSC